MIVQHLFKLNLNSMNKMEIKIFSIDLLRCRKRRGGIKSIKNKMKELRQLLTESLKYRNIKRVRRGSCRTTIRAIKLN